MGQRIEIGLGLLRLYDYGPLRFDALRTSLEITQFDVRQQFLQKPLVKIYFDDDLKQGYFSFA